VSDETKPAKVDGRRKNNLSAEQRSRIGKMGGTATSANREFMRLIGSKGGKAVSQDRNHMAEIGRKGGSA
jgi:general stress protein YciG